MEPGRWKRSRLPAQHGTAARMHSCRWLGPTTWGEVPGHMGWKKREREMGLGRSALQESSISELVYDKVWAAEVALSIIGKVPRWGDGSDWWDLREALLICCTTVSAGVHFLPAYMRWTAMVTVGTMLLDILCHLINRIVPRQSTSTTYVFSKHLDPLILLPRRSQSFRVFHKK